MGIVQNIFGGGDAQKVDLELKTSELEAHKAGIASKPKDRVLTELLRFEELHNQSELQAAIATRFKVIEVGYRLGEGSTAEMIALMSQLDTRLGRLFRPSINYLHTKSLLAISRSNSL